MTRKPIRKAVQNQIEKPIKDTSYDPVFTSERAAKYLGYSYEGFRKMRSEEDGPIYIVFGKRDKRYQLSDLNAWKNKKRQKTVDDLKILNEEINEILPSTFFYENPSYVRKQKIIKMLKRIRGWTKTFYFDLAVVIMLALALIFKLV